MLNKGIFQLFASSNEYFDHLIGDSSSTYTQASCIYIDAFDACGKILALIEIADVFFNRDGYKPKVFLLTSRDGLKSYSKSRSFVRTELERSEKEFIEKYSSVQIFPETRDTVDRTWRPPVYMGFDLSDRSNSLLYYTSRALNEHEMIRLIIDFKEISEFCAAYGFYFPIELSPIGYFYGISISPDSRKNKGYTVEKKERFVYWRGNTLTGVLQNEKRKFYSACDGYIRDAYPVIVLSKAHLDRKCGGISLPEFIERYQLGHLSQQDGVHVLRIPCKNLSKAQMLFDANNISLSGKLLSSEG